MLWFKAFHIIFVIMWFSGIFYLPRLFVYHAMTQDSLSNERFKIMERKLLFGIMTPAGLIATILGVITYAYNPDFYQHALWFQAKLFLVLLIWIYHGVCIKYWYDFKKDHNRHGHVFYRWFNEAPVILLIVIVLLVVIKP